jgi:hypothetical protein
MGASAGTVDPSLSTYQGINALIREIRICYVAFWTAFWVAFWVARSNLTTSSGRPATQKIGG